MGLQYYASRTCSLKRGQANSIHQAKEGAPSECNGRCGTTAHTCQFGSILYHPISLSILDSLANFPNYSTVDLFPVAYKILVSTQDPVILDTKYFSDEKKSFYCAG